MKKNKYHKYKGYYQEYYQKNKPPRKFPFCVLCGRVNQNDRFIKVCSVSCSLLLNRINQIRANQDFYWRQKNRENISI